MSEHRIEYETREEPRTLWATYAGTKEVALGCAYNLLGDLRVGYPKAKVWLDGKRVHLEKAR